MLHLNYKKYGTGKPLIILHGFLGSLDNWHTLATEWGKSGIGVYTVDLRNHGRSPHTEEHSIKLMSDDIFDFLEQQNLDKINLLGHSMGGKVAMHFALNHPEKVDKLIIADIAPGAYKHSHDDVFSAIFNVDITKIRSRKEAEEMMIKYLPDFGTRQFILKNLERSDEGNYDWKFNIKTLFREYDETIKAVSSGHIFSNDVLFLKGGSSTYIRERDTPEILKLFPNASIEIIENAGHWLHADKPKEFSEKVIHFLNENNS